MPPTIRTDAEWLTSAEACHYLSCCRMTLYKLRRAKILYATRVGNRLRYRRSSLDKALAKRERTGR